MPRRYSIDGEQNVASPTDTTLTLTGGTTNRPEIYDGWLGVSATPADNALTWYMQRTTAAGTGTAVTAQALDSGDPAAIATALEDHSAEPTYTAAAIVFRLALNQRASHKLNIDPNSPIRIPATANNGIGLYPVHASFTGLTDACVCTRVSGSLKGLSPPSCSMPIRSLFRADPACQHCASSA